MSRLVPRAALLAAVLCVAACGGVPPLPPPPPEPPAVAPANHLAVPEALAETKDEPFREHMPGPSGSVVFTPPKIDAFKLKNGVRVLLVERHDLPVVAVRVVVKGGAGDLAVRPGVLAMMGGLLEQGTTTRSAIEISDQLEAIGAQHGAGAGWDSVNVSTKVLRPQLDQGLELLADVTLHPAFPEAEIARLKARKLAALQQEKSSPGAAAWNALFAAVYGRAHPYGHALGGQQADVEKIDRNAVLAAYRAAFVPSRAAIVVAGDVTREEIAPKLEASFGAWRGGAANALPPVAPEKVKAGTPRLVVVDIPGATQSQVMLTEVGVSHASTDRDALTVMNEILGGAFSSRINMNLREAHAYTYGARSRFAMRRGSGPFSAGGAIFVEATAPAVQELFNEVRGMTERNVTDDELADAKEHLKLGLPGHFETVNDVTSALEDLVVYDLPLDEYEKWGARIDAVTAVDVHRVAMAHLHPRTMRVVVVGDRSKVGGALETLHLGDAEARDVYGDLLAPVSAPPTSAPPAKATK